MPFLLELPQYETAKVEAPPPSFDFALIKKEQAVWIEIKQLERIQIQDDSDDEEEEIKIESAEQ
jgi:hypothetical protein